MSFQPTNLNIQAAVDDWCANPQVPATYNNIDINSWDTSLVTDMSSLFSQKGTFNNNLNGWDVSNVHTMFNMFDRASAFNGDISNWDTSSVTTMGYMFDNASAFNGDINTVSGNWDVSNVTSMYRMFYQATAFNKPINLWDVSSVGSPDSTNQRTFEQMFQGATAFNKYIRSWSVQSADVLTSMFQDATAFHTAYYTTTPGYDTANHTPTYEFFNMSFQPTNSNIQAAVDAWCASPQVPATYNSVDISSWDTSLVTDMTNLFNGKSTFNDNISGWDVSLVTTMESVFDGASAFNQPIGDWNVSNVTSMGSMFRGATAFNKPIGDWVVSSNINFGNTFYSATSFDQPIGDWNTSNVVFMGSMFQYASAFNQPIGGWNVSNVNNMIAMFGDALLFNQSISDWNVSAVTDMSWMFATAPDFLQEIRTWTVQDGDYLHNMFTGATAFQGHYYPLTPGYDSNNTTPTYEFFNQDAANICFPPGTLVSLDQGDIEIQNVDTSKHTLNGKKILFVTQTIPTKPDVVRIEKGAFASNVPSQTVETTRAHIIEYNGERKMAEEWVNDKSITFVPNTHKILYNLLLETHEMMTVYNLQAETLNPVRKLAHKYFAKLIKEKEIC